MPPWLFIDRRHDHHVRFLPPSAALLIVGARHACLDRPYAIEHCDCAATATLLRSKRNLSGAVPYLPHGPFVLDDFYPH
jgi:hypothetical protein